MSDSSLSDSAPSTAALKQALRDAVREVYRSGDLDNLTIKRIRKSVEANLDLQDDFFKNDPAWKEKSKNIIQAEVDSQANDNANANADGVSPSSNPSSHPFTKRKMAQSNLSKSQKPNRDSGGTKRPSSDNVGHNKRRRKETPDVTGSTSEVEDVSKQKPIPKANKRAFAEKAGVNEHQGKENSDTYLSDSADSEEEELLSKNSVPKLRRNTGPRPEPEIDEQDDQTSKDISGSSRANGIGATASESEMSEVFDEAPKTKHRKRKSNSAKPGAKANGMTADASDEEMSKVLDQAPKVKGRKRRSDSGQPRAKKTETSNGKKSSEQSIDPNADEIKRLQGWLIKCGIRKMWHRELAPYDNSKAKIGHLKKLLADAGMTGRYSIEKANQIKEERELRADLEAVQEGARQWGKAESEEEDNSGRPKRRLARGLQELNFLNDDDGEETD